MTFLPECIDRLLRAKQCAYTPNGPWAAEPTAWAALALIGHGKTTTARRFALQLADNQTGSGAVGVFQEHSEPGWPTSLAILAWVADQQGSGASVFAANIHSGVAWALASQGKTAPPQPEVGHDPRILGWSWAANTHAWMEPTCMFALALKAAGLQDHERTREAVRLITDRLLPTGGCNFGSTTVLGQATLPQVQSTGLAMMALAGEDLSDPRIELSLVYLTDCLNEQTTTASLCFGVMGLTAQGRRPPHAEHWLQKAFDREVAHGTSEYKLGLLALAALSDLSQVPGLPARILA